MTDLTTERPKARDGYLIAKGNILLDDGVSVPAFREMTEDDFMDEFGLEATDKAWAARDAELGKAVPLMQVNGEEATPGLAEPPPAPVNDEDKLPTADEFYAQSAADAVKALRAVADAIEKGEPVGAVILLALGLNGPPVLNACWPMAKDQYERALGSLTKLQVKMAMDDRRI